MLRRALTETIVEPVMTVKVDLMVLDPSIAQAVDYHRNGLRGHGSASEKMHKAALNGE